MGYFIPLLAGAITLGAVASTSHTRSQASKRDLARKRAQEDERFRIHYSTACRLLGLRSPPRWYFDARHPNAYYDPNGHIIGFNRVFFRRILRATCSHSECTDAVVLGIIAHELGHSMQRQRLLHRQITNHQAELGADQVAGKVLALAGLPVQDLERAILLLGEHATQTHPAGHDRAAAIRYGYHGYYIRFLT